MDFLEPLLIWLASCFPFFIPLIIPVGSYGFYKHAARHTDGTDDIRNATNTLKGLMTATQVTELEESSGISTAQWGYLGGSSGIDHYVDRGDPANWDKQVGDFTTNDTWNDLDLSSIVPAGATAVLIQGQIKDDAVNSYLAFRKNGNANARVEAVVRTQVANNPVDFCFVVACDTNRVIEYKGANLAFTTIDFVVNGWWI